MDARLHRIATGLLVAAVLMPFASFADQKTMDLAVLILTYVMLGWA